MDEWRSQLIALNAKATRLGLAHEDMRKCRDSLTSVSGSNLYRYMAMLVLAVAIYVWSKAGDRCLVANNYVIWEAVRPRSSCLQCVGVRGPAVLVNASRDSFSRHAYSEGPLLAKGAAGSWPAMSTLDLQHLRHLHALSSSDCQFLHFDTHLFSPEEVFSDDLRRSQAWYVGWGNCDPLAAADMRRHYGVPDFLPADAEFPLTDNVFFGYEGGALMHLDYIPRIMWQGQVRGNKTWTLAPVPECEHLCTPFDFHVEPGDIVLLDTRIWYHSTRIPPGQFSLTIQSEYG